MAGAACKNEKTDICFFESFFYFASMQAQERQCMILPWGGTGKARSGFEYIPQKTNAFFIGDVSLSACLRTGRKAPVRFKYFLSIQWT